MSWPAANDAEQCATMDPAGMGDQSSGLSTCLREYISGTHTEDQRMQRPIRDGGMAPTGGIRGAIPRLVRSLGE